MNMEYLSYIYMDNVCLENLSVSKYWIPQCSNITPFIRFILTNMTQANKYILELYSLQGYKHLE